MTKEYYPPAESVPFWIQKEYKMVTHAFPEGMTDYQRCAVMKMLLPGMSIRTLARLISCLTGKETYLDFLDDVYGLAWAVIDEEIQENVSMCLKLQGYDSWLSENMQNERSPAE